MNILDCIFLSYMNLKNRKKNVYTTIILISLAVVIFVISLSYTNKFLESMEKAINKNISYRTIAVIPNYETSQEEIIKKVLNVSNIVKVVPQKEYYTAVDIENIDNNLLDNASVSIQGANEDIQPSIIEGRGFYKNENDVCIIPEKFYPYNLDENFNSEDLIDGKTLIGKDIIIKYYSYDYSDGIQKVNQAFEKKLTVIGIYNQDENMAEYNDCYISFNDMSSIISDIKENTVYSENTIVAGGNGVFAIVDEAKNVKSVESALKELGNDDYRVIIRSVANTELMESIQIVCVIVSIVLMFIAFVNITISTIKSAIERKYEIGMQKAIGFKNRQIQWITFTENIIIGSLSYIVAIALTVIINIILKKYIIDTNSQLYQIGLNIDIIICLIALIISLIIPTISSFICNIAILKKTPVSLNKER